VARVSVVLITGASAGIGAATARELDARGFEVYGTSRQPERLAPGAPPISWIAMDVRDEGSVQAGVAQLLARAGRLDAVVCNAGFGIFGSIEEVSIADAQAQLDTNFFGVLRTLRATLPLLRKQGAGRVVLIGSLAGRAPIPFQAHYSASKAAVDALAQALHNELCGSGVQVALVEPGDIRTGFNDEIDFSSADASPYGARIARCRAVIEDSLKDAPAPEQVARVIRRALCDARPRFRYAVGREAPLVALGRRLLPDRLALGLLRRHFRV
jgi:NAD(P)-dependent dehydrogenase (short-subunit alcohol dehydrogenase family)